MSKPSYATYIKDRLERIRRHRQHVRVSGPDRFSQPRQARVRRSGTFAAQDARVQCGDRRARSAGGAGRRRPSEGRVRRRRSTGSVHDRGVARRGVAVLPQRALSDRGSVPVRDRGCDAAGVRDDRQGRHRPADRLPRSRDGTAHPACRLESGGVAQEGAASRRGTRSCRREHPPRAAAHAPVLGQLRRAASLRRALGRRDRHRVPRAAERHRASRPPTRATRTNGSCSRRSSCPTASCSFPA